MSFTGLFKAKDGLAAVVDSKGSINLDGTFSEDIGRQPQKLFPFSGGIAVSCGANQILVQNSIRIFSQKMNIEELVYEYLRKKPVLNPDFFQSLLVKMGTNPSNTEPVHFLVGRKIRAGEYQLEHYKIGYHYYAEKISPASDDFLLGGDELYRIAFSRLDYSSYLSSVDSLQKYAAASLRQFIDFFDKTLSYNSVGEPVKSYIIR